MLLDYHYDTKLSYEFNKLYDYDRDDADCNKVIKMMKLENVMRISFMDMMAVLTFECAAKFMQTLKIVEMMKIIIKMWRKETS